jgi:pimeloyl-ACP methyl ester carboxylesterase
MTTEHRVRPVRLDVERSGTGARRLVLTHGLGDDASTWDGVVGPLVDAGLTVVRWDLRGHGRSDAPDDPLAYSRELGIADLAGMVGSEPAHLVGHSLGGHLSLALALRRPDLVHTLTLIASGPGFRDPAARARWDAEVHRVAARFPIPPAAAGLCLQPDSSVIDALPGLAPPLLQIVGGDDTRYHAGVAYTDSKVVDGTVATIAGAGHHPQQTHAAAVAAAAVAHVSAVRARPQG